MNVNNCDILIENGRLRLFYNLPGCLFPVQVIDTRSNHIFNERAIKIFGPKSWIRYLAKQAADKSISPVHPLLGDVYRNHKEDCIAVCHSVGKNDADYNSAD